MKGLVFVLTVGACSKPALYGSAMPLNMAPAPPAFATSFDFDLLAPLRGEDCVERSEMEARLFWTATYNIDTFSSDELTRSAIAAAAYDAANNLEGVDAFIVTRVIATARGEDTVCAKVYGRGLRLKKYEPPQPATIRASKAADDADEDDDDDGKAEPQDPFE